jgi:hypothetical protein
LDLVSFSLTPRPARGFDIAVEVEGARHIDVFRRWALIPYDR